MSAGSQLSGMFYQKLPAHTLLPARAGKSHSKTVCWKHWRSWGCCWRYQCSNTDALALPNSSRLKGGRWQGVSLIFVKPRTCNSISGFGAGNCVDEVLGSCFHASW